MKEVIYDNDGTPIAYLDTEDRNTIFLWNGVPVAYLDRANSVYGFNGLQLGWYINGVMRDLDGYVVGFNRKAANVVVKVCPSKSFKQCKPVKRNKQICRIKPMWKNSSSVIYLSQFLTRGIL